jgi:hypothetical protein
LSISPRLAPEFSLIACFTAVISSELFFRFPREKLSLMTEREREGEGE